MLEMAEIESISRKQIANSDTNLKMPTKSSSSESSILSSIDSRSLNNLQNVDGLFTKPNIASSSSGYGASINSALSVFVNLDNYYFDENFAKVTFKLNIFYKSVIE
jgi:hypothetical protein